MTQREFEGLVCAVTGGGNGLGAAIAEHFDSRGGKVAVLDLNLTSVPGSMLGVRLDVTDDHQVREAITAVVSQLGGLDILVNCAGIGAQGTVEQNPDSEWFHVLDVNVLGAVRTTRAALPHLLQSRSAAIVNMCSVVATVGVQDRVLYSASKGAVAAMTRAMAADLVQRGIRVNAVNPGTADTSWVSRMISAENSDQDRRALQDRHPHGRLVSAAEVAHAVGYLASPLATSTIGVTLAVDGGLDSLYVRPQRN